MKKLYSIREFIIMIQERTAMYIGGRTITHLKAFLDGWLYGMEDNIVDAYLLDEFQNWLENKYNITSSQSWDKIILFYSSDSYNALINFFNLFEEYLETKIKEK